MSRIVIESEHPESLAALLRGAIAHQIHLLQIGLRKTEQRLTSFEQKHGMNTDSFYRRYNQGTLGDALDYMEWAGEYETLQRLREQYRQLKYAELCS